MNVDIQCALQGVKVYKDFSCTLNQTNIGKNANKFYIIQILEREDGRGYYLWTRYGRVGKDGNKGVEERSTVDAAVRAFVARFRSKTGHDWYKKETHKEIIPEKYVPVDIQSVEVVEEESAQDSSVELPKKVVEFIDLIAEKKMFVETLQTFNIDSKKMPLGRISNDQIERGNEILSSLQYLVRADKKLARASLKALGIEPDKYIDSRLLDQSSAFWTVIPFDCGYKTAPIIKTDKDVERCSELLDVLRNMEVAGKILRKRTSRKEIYDALHVDIEHVNPSSDEWDLLERYVKNSKGETHCYELELLEAYTITVPPPENSGFDLPNHKLLFHGSRTANYMGILSEGLRVPSPNQVLNGSVFGRGIYFADSISKSFNYCHVSGGNGIGIGLVLVCEVALGDTQTVTQATFDDRPMGYHSRTAVGVRSSDSEIHRFEGREVEVPCKPLKMTNNSLAHSLQYNEYIIYDPAQYKFRFVLKLGIKN